MSYENSVEICAIWPAAFARVHVDLLFITIWVCAWEYVSYECHWSSVVAEAKLKTSAWGLFCILLCSELSPQVDASWISAITHSPFSGTSESFIKPPTGHLYVDVLQLPKHVTVWNWTHFLSYSPNPTALYSVWYIFTDYIIIHPGHLEH